jgi:hypothetical protein
MGKSTDKIMHVGKLLRLLLATLLQPSHVHAGAHLSDFGLTNKVYCLVMFYMLSLLLFCFYLYLVLLNSVTRDDWM